MTRINTNVGALIAQTHLKRTNVDLQTSLQRLSSGLKINRGADDPAGLIASESLRSEIAGIGQAISNSERASNVIATAEGALNEVASMLINIQELVVGAANSGGMSPDEINANQLQVDSAIESITRISNTTSFAGLQLLNGNLGYIASGVKQSCINDLNIYSAQFGTQPYIPVTVTVTTSAQKAQLKFSGTTVTQSCTIEIRGALGVMTLPLLPNATTSAIMQAVNTRADATGISCAYYHSNMNSGLVFQSSGYGTSEFVSVTALTGNFTVKDLGSNTVTRDVGRDVVANINGISTKGSGLTVNLQSLGLDFEFRLTEGFNVTSAAGTSRFSITGGGAKFQLGPAVNTNQQVSVGIRSTAASNLGNANDGYLSDITSTGVYSLSKNAAQASRIIQEAVRQVSVLRGRLGAFEKNVVQTNINSLQITMENVTASESQIRDADFAEETSRLTRAQVLNQAGTSVLSIANQTPQSVLSLLAR
jgi:flagellin